VVPSQVGAQALVKNWSLTGASNLFPGYFAVVMATGATAICAELLGFALIARALFVAAVLAYTTLWYFTLLRLRYYPKRLVQDMNSHARGPGFFTLVAATSITGSAVWVLFQAEVIAFSLWLFACFLWLLIMYSFFIAVTIRRVKPGLTEGINGAWLLAAVATQSLAVLAGLLPVSGYQELTLFIGLCMYLLGAMLYLSIITLIFYRLTFLKVTVESLTPPYWINMGAVAIATLAGSTLMSRASNSELITLCLPFLRGFTLLFWVTASWWIPMLVGLTLWRHWVRRHPLRYEPQLWSIVFPLAMYTTGTWKLAQALELPFLASIPQVTFWIALFAWVVTSLGFWRYIWHSMRDCGAAPAERL